MKLHPATSSFHPDFSCEKSSGGIAVAHHGLTMIDWMVRFNVNPGGKDF
jgi:hypothetical protein